MSSPPLRGGREINRKNELHVPSQSFGHGRLTTFHCSVSSFSVPSQPWKCKPAKTRQHVKPGHTTTARCGASCPFHECKQCPSHLASISDMALWPDGQGIGTKDCRFESCQNHFFNHVHSFPSLIHFHEKPCHLSHFQKFNISGECLSTLALV